jgi:hypothetical protein
MSITETMINKGKKKPKLGTGGRFAVLKAKLAEKGARNPEALAAYIGRKKYGIKKMASLSAKERNK